MANHILTESDFRHLVRGGTLRLDSDTQIALADMGFGRMLAILNLSAAMADEGEDLIGIVKDKEL